MQTLTTRRNLSTVLLLVTAVVVVVPAVTTACPLCKESVANDEVADGSRTGPTRTARAYGWSIAVMLSMPFLIVGGITWIAVNAYRRNLARQQSAAHAASDVTDPQHPRPPADG